MEFLQKYRAFETRDFDAGEQFTSQLWEDHHSLLRSKQYGITWNQAELQRSSLSYVDHPCSLQVECNGPVSDTFRILFHQSGARMGHTINGKESFSFPGQCTVHPAGADLRLDIQPFSLLMLNLDGDGVRSALSQRFSKLPPLEDWATSFSTDSPGIVTLNSLCHWMAKELENPQSLLLTQKRAGASFERTLLTLFIEALVERCPSADGIRGNLSELHVKRAEEWIDTHLEEPIGAEEVASALGVNAQVLVQTFKRARGYSLARAILQRRLERARDALRTGGPNTTVTDVATALGFFELGRFAARYRERFGEKPSETLARSRGHASG